MLDLSLILLYTFLTIKNLNL